MLPIEVQELLTMIVAMVLVEPFELWRTMPPLIPPNIVFSEMIL